MVIGIAMNSQYDSSDDGCKCNNGKYEPGWLPIEYDGSTEVIKTRIGCFRGNNCYCVRTDNDRTPHSQIYEADL